MKKFISAFLCLIALVSIAFPAYAYEIEEESISRISNAGNITTSFAISNTGEAVVKTKFSGKYGEFKTATVSTKIQKKVGLIWVNVDGASWSVTTTKTSLTKTYSYQLSGKGTYRAHVELSLTGVDSGNDSFTNNVEKTY